MSDEEDEQTNINSNNIIQQDLVELHSSEEFGLPINDRNNEEDATNENSDNILQRYDSSEQQTQPESPLVSENLEKADGTNEQPPENELSRLHQLLDSESQQMNDEKYDILDSIAQNDENSLPINSESPQINNEETINVSLDQIIQDNAAEPSPESEIQVNEETVDENIDNGQPDGMEIPPPPPPPPPPEDFFTETSNKPFVPVGGIQLIPGEMPKLRKVEKKVEPEKDSDSENPVDFASFKDKLNSLLSAQVNKITNQPPPKPVKQSVQINKEEEYKSQIENTKFENEVPSNTQQPQLNGENNENMDNDEEAINENVDNISQEFDNIPPPPPPPPPPPEDFFTETTNESFVPVGGIQLIPGEMPKLRKVEKKVEPEQDSDTEKPLDFAAFKDKLNSILVVQVNKIADQLPPRPAQQLINREKLLYKQIEEEAAAIENLNKNIQNDISELPPQPESDLLQVNEVIIDNVPKNDAVEPQQPIEIESQVIGIDPQVNEDDALEEEINGILNIFMHDDEDESLPPPESELPQVNDVDIIEPQLQETIIETKMVEEPPPDQPLSLEGKKMDSFQNALVEKLKERKEILENNPIPIEQMQQKKSIELQRLEDQINSLTKTKSDNIFSSHGSM